jgi:hypothetical protein
MKKECLLLLFGQFLHSNCISLVAHSHFHGSLTFEILEKIKLFHRKVSKMGFYTTRISV